MVENLKNIDMIEFGHQNMEYWPIKYMPAAKNLDTYDKSYKLPTPSLISFSGRPYISIYAKKDYRCI